MQQKPKQADPPTKYVYAKAAEEDSNFERGQKRREKIWRLFVLFRLNMMDISVSGAKTRCSSSSGQDVHACPEMRRKGPEITDHHHHFPPLAC